MDEISILFISADQDQLDSFSELIRENNHPFDLQSCSNAEEVYRALHSNNFDIIISDYSFTDDSLESLFPDLASLPLIVLAGEENESQISELVNKGLSDFLLKDRSGNYIRFLPIYIRKVLRNFDASETADIIIKSYEKRYFDLLQAIPDIVYKIDPKGRFTFINNAVRSLGYEPNELIGKHFSYIIEEKLLDHVSRMEVLKDFRGKVTGIEGAPKLFDERRSGERRTNNLEIQIRRKNVLPDGKYSDRIIGTLVAYGEVSATGQYRNGKQQKYFIGTVGIIRDITLRKKSEEMIQKLFNAVDQSPISIMIFEKSGNVEYANPYFFHLNKLKPEDILGKSADLLKSKYLPLEHSEQLSECIEEDRPWQGEIKVIPEEDEEAKYFYISLSPVLNNKGRVTHFIVFQTSLDEKEDVAGESQGASGIRKKIHHRVKNNLQLLLSLMNLQLGDIADTELRTYFQNSKNHILCLSLLYEKLVKSEDQESIDIDGYLRSLISTLVYTYDLDPDSIDYDIDFCECRVPVNTALDCALIVNEISAFMIKKIAERTGKAVIHYRFTFSEENYNLTVYCQELTAEEHDKNALSIRLVEALSDQLGGELNVSETDILSYSLDFTI